VTSAFLFILIALAYAVAKIILEKRLAPLDAGGDERQLADLAFSCGCSVYDLFKTAAAPWNFSGRKIDEDFKRYVTVGDVPGYVHDFLGHHLQTKDRTYQTLIFSGGRPP
jgi:hypothetical protein